MQKVFKIYSSQQVILADNSKRWAIDIAAVISHMATGGGLLRLNEILATLEIYTWHEEGYVFTHREIYWRTDRESASNVPGRDSSHFY